MQENQRFNVGQLLLSPRHHQAKQTVLRFPRNFWDISYHMVHTPFSPSTCFSLTLSFFSQQCSFLHRTQTYSSILEACILSANHGALMLCISTNDRAVGVEPASMSDSATCLSLHPFSFFYHLPFSFSFSPSPSLLIYYTNEAEVRIWHKQTPILEGIQNPTIPTYTY